MLLAACSAEAPEPERSKAGKQVAPAPAAPAQARQVEEKSDLLEFTYGWPVEAASIPALVRQLEADMARDRAEAVTMARDDKASREAGAEFNGHYLSKIWKNY